MAARDGDLVERYRTETGREPSRLPDDHPDAWQWDYRGTPAERKALYEEFGLAREEKPLVIDGQEEMF